MTQMRKALSAGAIGLAFVTIVLSIGPLTALAQVEVAEVALPAQTLEPGAGSPITTTTLGDGVVVFEINVEDVDPQADDSSSPAIECFVVQNLGTAGVTDVAQVAILNKDGEVIELLDSDDHDYQAAAPLVIALDDPTNKSFPIAPFDGSVCPDGGGSNVQWEALFSAPFDDDEPDDGLPTVVPDSSNRKFKIAVRLEDSADLGSGSQNHTIRLRVLMQYRESVGSPPTQSTFTTSISDSTQDFVWNGGVNRLSELSVPTVPPSIPPGESGVVGSFQLCDDDAQSPSLKINDINLIQGPNGNANGADIDSFNIKEVNVPGSQSLSTVTSDFNRGGPGQDWSLNLEVDDDSCKQYRIEATIADSAMQARTIHLQVRFTGVHEGQDIQGVTPTMQFSRSVIIGSGVISLPNVQLPLREGSVPLEIQDLNEGLERIEVQTGSIQFDPNFIQVDGVDGIAPYEVQSESVQIDNRRGQLRFTLALASGVQTSSAEVSGRVASIRLHPTDGAVAGQSSILLLQLDRVTTVDGGSTDITSSVIVANGGLTWRSPGDLDNDGSPSVRDVLLLANAILNECEDLTDDERISADVAGTVGNGDRAPVGKVPTCTDPEATAPTDAKFEADDQKDLTSSDVSQIATLSLEATALGATRQSVRSRDKTLDISGWSWFDGLKRLLGWPTDAPTQPTEFQLVPSDGGYAVQAAAGATIGGLQGRIHYDPQAMNVDGIEGLNGYEVLASRVDGRRGEIRFLALAPIGDGSRSERVLKLTTAGSSDRDSQVRLSVDMLLDPQGNSLDYRVDASSAARGLSVQALTLRHPEVGRWTLEVRGQGVERVSVQGFDLGGQRRFASTARGTSLQWRALDERTGQPLANGVYLYRVTVEGAGGDVWRSDVRKLVVLR